MASPSAMVDENDTGTMVHIAPDGDVVLVIGQTQRRLRVHSLIANRASPVLNAMLGPTFREGQQLATTGSSEIPLPEDDADAMEIILNVIHCRNDEVKKILSPGELLRVAIACEKYDCFVPLEFAIQTWLSHMSATKSEDLWAWAVAACLFHEQQAFADATFALASSLAGSFIDLTSMRETAVMLEEARNELRICLLRGVLNGDWHCCASSKKARHRPDCLTQLARRTCGLDIMSVADAFDALSGNASYPAADYPAEFGDDFGAEQQDSFHDRFRTQQAKAGRLCLRCVRTGEEHGRHEGGTA